MSWGVGRAVFLVDSGVVTVDDSDYIAFHFHCDAALVGTGEYWCSTAGVGCDGVS